MPIEHDREKLLNAIVYFLRKTEFCGKTKLCKLLYYLDFMHFRESGKSVTGLDYYAWDFGPVPSDLFFEMNNPSPDLRKYIFIPRTTDDKTFIEIKPRKIFDKKYFTKRELRVLENVAFIFKHAQAEDMVEASHLSNHPWDKTIKEKGEKAKIDYLFAVDDSKDSLGIKEILERIEDRKAIKKAFQ